MPEPGASVQGPLDYQPSTERAAWKRTYLCQAIDQFTDMICCANLLVTNLNRFFIYRQRYRQGSQGGERVTAAVPQGHFDRGYLRAYSVLSKLQEKPDTFEFTAPSK
jgi:hypothetical protein